MKKQIIVIGGGAAGFFGAIAAAEANLEAEVTLLEKQSKLLVKVGISGGGRCNVTHACFDPKQLVQHYPRGHRELLGPFNRFGPSEMVAWLQAAGVELKTEEDGRMFPVTDDSRTIIDCLLERAKSLSIIIEEKTAVESVQQLPEGPFELILNDGSSMQCDRLLITTGGGRSNKGYVIAEHFGHTIVEPVPSLFTFNIEDSRIDGLAGISFPEAAIAVVGSALKSTGPLLITHWGLSGPCILKLSAWGAREFYAKDYQFEITINFLPSFTKDSLVADLKRQKTALSQKQISKNTLYGLPKRFWTQVTAVASIDEALKWKQANDQQLQHLATELTAGTYSVNGKSTFKEEFVTAGGVSLKEINFKTMESQCVPGLYFAGEVLDIDAVTGGFNFQAAWTTSYIAGKAL